jgi:hypothetical protein
VSSARERLTYRPFTPATLAADLRATGFTLQSSTFAPDAERYAAVARRL